MKTTRRMAAGIVLRRLLIITAVLLLLLIGKPVANRVTFAGATVGSFEIDGNLTVDHPAPPAEPIDWNSTPFPAALSQFRPRRRLQFARRQLQTDAGGSERLCYGPNGVGAADAG